MNYRSAFWRGIFFLTVLFTPPACVRAGTNDLFQSVTTWRCVQAVSVNSAGSTAFKLRLTNPTLLNLAMGNSVDAVVPANLKIGLQCNCSNLQMNVVIYDAATMEAVLTLADITTDSYRSNGKKAMILCSGSIHTNGFLLGGRFTAQMIARLDGDACAKQARISTAGRLEIETTDGPMSMNLQSGKLRTFGSQLRSVTTTGSGNYGSSGTLATAGGLVEQLQTAGFGWGGGVITNTGTIVVGGPPAMVQSCNLNIGTNAIVSFPTAQLDSTASCDGTLVVLADGTLSLGSSLLLCTNSAINLSSGAMLNVCTNGMAEDVLNVLLNAVSGEGTLNLTNCASSTPS